MGRGTLFPAVLAGLALSAGTVRADTAWTGAGDGSSWSDAANWSNGAPGGQRRAFINGAATVHIGPAVNDAISRLLLADDGAGDNVLVNMSGGNLDLTLDLESSRNLELGSVGDATFHMTGGTVTVGLNFRLAADHAPGATGLATLTMDGGAVTVNNRFYAPFGNGRTAVVEMNDGSITAHQFFLSDGIGSTGTLNMTGGTINAGDFWMPTNLGSEGATAHVQLDGGTIHVGRTFILTNDGSLDIKGTMDITNGRLILPGDLTQDPVLLGYISGGLLTGYGGAGSVVLAYETDVGTIVSAIPEPATMVLFGLGGLALIRRKKRH